MKRIYNISVKRSKNYESVALTEGFEADMTDEAFEQEKRIISERVNSEVQKELDNLNKKKFNLEV